MGAARQIDINERRARLGVRHHLANPAPDIETVAADLVGLHSSDPVTVYLSCRARLDDFDRSDLESTLYDRRSLVRMLGMRRTMFVVPIDLAAVMDAACTKALAPPERRRLAGYLETQGITDNASEWLSDVEAKVLSALARRGEATATDLRNDIEEFATKLVFAGGTFGVSTRVLFLLASEGRILRGRPRGTWRSTMYRWVRTEDWLGGPLREIDTGTAAADLARRWLGRYGPGTLLDLKWWAGWTARLTRSALDAVGAVEVGLDGATGFVLPDDLDVVSAPAPWARFLPGLDPTVMGWKERDWYLGSHERLLFDSNGNAGPTVWWNGRTVGAWAQRQDGEIAYRLVEDVGSDGAAAIETEADHLTAWLGEERIIPRFSAPLSGELSG